MKKHLRITVNGKTYEVTAEILDDTAGAALAAAAGSPPLLAGSAAVPAAAAPPRTAPAPSTAAGSGEQRSPLAGKVVAVDVTPGTAVTAGQTLLTLEAMKMNNLIAAARNGTVQAVHVKPGESVEEGQLLVTIA